MTDKTLVLDELPGTRAAADMDTFVDACLVLAAQGHAAGLAGQITMRDGDSGRMFTLALGTGMDEAEAGRVLLVDAQLKTLEGSGRANPGALFHSWIYRHHPQVKAIVHTHPPALSALSMLGIPMPVAHMDAAMFHDDCGFLARWPGVPTGDEEGALISEVLHGKRTAFLVNHGAVCTGATMQEAIYLNVFAERNARMCLDALAAGPIQPVEPEAAREAHDFLLQPAIVNATFAYWARQARRAAKSSIA
ncbi:aldolase [Variovorax saccharolyticus]|uniref:aldolase n=1 Tax=Variovorax saccharolyticus TaxID=3053516 RepID=UPI002577F86B|nr:aldolase [Variovorax sp. J22R187]MDM0021000.1 aldolase [Variovorax sp. J22R187]